MQLEKQWIKLSKETVSIGKRPEMTNLTAYGNTTQEFTKLRLLKTVIFPIATYVSETWTINESIGKIIEAFKIKGYRKILRVLCTDHRTNESVLK